MRSIKRRLKPSETSAIILAAGHGTRMRPLTDNTPKPLLKIGGRSLIEHHIEKLSASGIKHIVVNTAYLGEQIQQQLGNGQHFGVQIDYSDESDTGALETAGGIKKSLPLIRSDPFIAINADIYTDFDFTSLLRLEITKQGCLVLVNNPEHNPSGDFGINADNLLDARSSTTMTFSGVALYSKAMFATLPEGKLALGPILKQMVKRKELAALKYSGGWADVGTPERLAQLNKA